MNLICLLINNILPNILIKSDDVLNISGLFSPHIKEIWLEVGFGSGEHLKWQIEKNKDIGIIGCEPYINGIANLLELLNEEELERVKIFGVVAHFTMKKHHHVK